ncbi:MAG TPA: SAM-dependent methyltransferase [Candidatus Acidoferrales bacterium]|nr:SAM-dependent methyltransferase [Candidatus Acidoferrales bacterium]
MAPPSTTETPLARLLKARIREQGAISFADYMRECLYHSEHGYYRAREAQRFADYYTSVDVHPIFGRLLARQLAEMWQALGRPEPFWVVEPGAGIGRLAKHILDFAARELREFYAALSYVVVEQSRERQAAQTATLARYVEAGCASSAAELPPEIPAGCVLSNELLDALPVHRVVHKQGVSCEIFVTLRNDEFVEQVRPLSTPALAEYFEVQDIELLEGQQAEVGLEACRWIEDVSRRLGRGFVLTVDYGHEARELYNAHHLRGTLLAYQQHRASEDYFRAPGEQDLTAHVNFTALELWGRHGGLERTGFVSQARFLLALGRRSGLTELYDEGQNEVERIQARLLWKNLIFPEGMGEVFRVMIQHKGVVSPQLTGLEPL